MKTAQRTRAPLSMPPQRLCCTVSCKAQPGLQRLPCTSKCNQHDSRRRSIAVAAAAEEAAAASDDTLTWLPQVAPTMESPKRAGLSLELENRSLKLCNDSLPGRAKWARRDEMGCRMHKALATLNGGSFNRSERKAQGGADLTVQAASSSIASKSGSLPYTREHSVQRVASSDGFESVDELADYTRKGLEGSEDDIAGRGPARDNALPAATRKWLRESQRALRKGPLSVGRCVELLDRARRLSGMHAERWRGEPADVLARLLVAAADTATARHKRACEEPLIAAEEQLPRRGGLQDIVEHVSTTKGRFQSQGAARSGSSHGHEECFSAREGPLPQQEDVASTGSHGSMQGRDLSQGGVGHRRLLPNSVRLLRAAEGAVKYNRAARAALAATPAVATSARQLLEAAEHDVLRPGTTLERRGRECRALCLAQLTFSVLSRRFWKALVRRGLFVPEGELAYWAVGTKTEENGTMDALTQRLRFSPPLTILFLHAATALKLHREPSNSTLVAELAIAAGAAACAVRPDTAASALAAFTQHSSATPLATHHAFAAAATSALPHLPFYSALGVIHDLANLHTPPSRALECSLLAFAASVGAPRNSHQWLLLLKALRRLGGKPPPEIGEAAAASFARQLPRPILPGTADALLACLSLGIHLEPFLVHTLTDRGLREFVRQLRVLCWGRAPGGRGWAHAFSVGLASVPRNRAKRAEVIGAVCGALGPPFVGLGEVEDVEVVATEWLQETLTSKGPAAAGAALHQLQRALQGARCR